jgi:hypothetical protein
MRKIHVHADIELKAIRHTIDAKEARGEDASGEINLYRAWLQYPDYAKADVRNVRAGFYKVLKGGK